MDSSLSRGVERSKHFYKALNQFEARASLGFDQGSESALSSASGSLSRRPKWREVLAETSARRGLRMWHGVRIPVPTAYRDVTPVMQQSLAAQGQVTSKIPTGPQAHGASKVKTTPYRPTSSTTSVHYEEQLVL